MSNSAFKDHLVQYRTIEKKKLILSLTITLVVMVLEIIGGLLTNSIALLSDAGHMFTHAFAISISLFAIHIVRKPPSQHKTYGSYRAEVLAAFINGLFLIPIAGIIIYESILRILYPQEVNSLYMLLIAFIGLVVNISSILILRGSHKDNLNVRGVFFHMIADAASSIGIIFASIVIFTTGWTIIDPIVSLGISIAILYWSYGILKESSRILLESAPKGLDTNIISEDLKKKFPDIKTLSNMHLWTISSNQLVFSAYLKLKNTSNNNSEAIIRNINDYLLEKYYIVESTIQLTSQG